MSLFVSTVKKILEDFGNSILYDKKRFISIFCDYAPELEEQIEFFRIADKTKIFEIIVESSKNTNIEKEKCINEIIMAFEKSGFVVDNNLKKFIQLFIECLPKNENEERTLWLDNEPFDFNKDFEKVIKSFKNNAFQNGNPVVLNNELSDHYFKYKGESIFAIISNCKEKYVEDLAIWKRDFFFEAEVLNEYERLFFLQEFNEALLKREEDCFKKLRIINYLDYLDFLFAVDTSNILYLFRQEHLKILNELSKRFEKERKIIARIYTYIGKFIEMDSDKKCEAKKYYKKSLDLFWECEKIEQKEVEDDEDFINDLEYQDDVRSGGAWFCYKEISKLNDYIKRLG